MSSSKSNIASNIKYTTPQKSSEYIINVTGTEQDITNEYKVQMTCAKNRGYSIGNAIRRTILTESKCWDVSAIHIEGITHQHATKNGLITPVIDIIANLKKLEIVYHGKVLDNQVVKFNIKYNSDENNVNVTSANIELPKDFEIINNDLLICTLDANVSFNAEILVLYAEGYVFENQIQYLPAISSDYIKLDVNGCKNIEVSVNVSSDNILDNLSIIITTSKSHNAEEVFKNAVATLYAMFSVLNDKSYYYLNTSNNNYKAAKWNEVSIDRLVNDGIITPHLANVFKQHNIITMQDLAAYPSNQLAQISGVGSMTITNIESFLFNYGLKVDSSKNMVGQSKMTNNTEGIDNIIGSE